MTATRTHRIEALVDGTTVLEGLTTARPSQTGELIIQPEYVRAGTLHVEPDGLVRVRPRPERSVDDDTQLAAAPRTVRIDPSHFCEVWIDGRLTHMTR